MSTPEMQEMVRQVHRSRQLYVARSRDGMAPMRVLFHPEHEIDLAAHLQDSPGDGRLTPAAGPTLFGMLIKFDMSVMPGTFRFEP